MPSGHSIRGMQLNWSTPMLLFAFLGLIFNLMQLFFQELLIDLGLSMINRQSFEVDEDLPPFLSSIKLTFADELVMEAQNLRDNYNIEIEFPDVIEKLDNTDMP